MSIDKIRLEVDLPYDEEAIKSRDPVQLADYMRELVGTLNEILQEIAAASNLTIDLVNGAAVYYALKDKNGAYPEYTWRRIQVGDNLEDQILIGGDSLSGTWTMVQRRERSA